MSSLVFFWFPPGGGGDVGLLLLLPPPMRSSPAIPFIKSALPVPPLGAAPPLLGPPMALPLSPNTPSRSSKLLLPVGVPTAGDSTRVGVPARPSRPDMPAPGSFWADAGAPPSKSISRRFSTLFWVCGGGAPPLTAAAAAAAAKGFSRAFWICSLRTG